MQLKGSTARQYTTTANYRNHVHCELYFLRFRGVPAKVHLLRQSSIRSLSISTKPSLRQWLPGVSLNLTLYHITLFTFLTSTTFSTGGCLAVLDLCGWLSGGASPWGPGCSSWGTSPPGSFWPPTARRATPSWRSACSISWSGGASLWGPGRSSWGTSPPGSFWPPTARLATLSWRNWLCNICCFTLIADCSCAVAGFKRPAFIKLLVIYRVCACLRR